MNYQPTKVWWDDDAAAQALFVNALREVLDLDPLPVSTAPRKARQTSENNASSSSRRIFKPAS